MLLLFFFKKKERKKQRKNKIFQEFIKLYSGYSGIIKKNTVQKMGGDITEMENSYYGFYCSLLRILRSFITDITGLFLRILLTLNQDTKKASKPSYLRKPWNDLLRILRILPNIADITEIAITEYYRILRSVISPTPYGVAKFAVETRKFLGQLDKGPWTRRGTSPPCR